MTKIELKGDLSIQNAEELHKVFLSASQKKSDIELNVTGLEDFDASIIQLVFALYRAVDKERPIIFTGSVSSTVKRRLYLCGMIASSEMDDEAVLKSLNAKMEAER